MTLHPDPGVGQSRDAVPLTPDEARYPDGSPAAPPPATAPPPAAGMARRRWRGALALVLVSLLAGTAAAVTTHALETGLGGVTTTRTVIVPPSQQFPPGTVDVATLVATVEPAVVIIEVTYRPGQPATAGAGTGIVLSPDGYVLTNAHVVAGAATITIIPAGTDSTLPAQPVGADAAADIALLRLPAGTSLPAATLARSSTVRVGDDVVAIGNALNLGSTPSVTRGIVSATGRAIETASGHLTGLIQTDTSISSGNSGGPLVNSTGKVIGVVTATATASRTTAVENVGFAIPTDRVLPVLRRLGLTLTVR